MTSVDVDNNNCPVVQEESETKTNNSKETPICETDANFAVICSFIEQFGSSLDLHLDIEKLKLMLETNDTTPEELVELHIRLLRKRRKYIQRDKWERALARFVAEYSNVDAWELERYGYKNVNLGIRITAFKNLLEAQFDYNNKFKTGINTMEASTLRLAPIGRDIHGNQYWFQLDPGLCLRVYREEPDDEKSWILICKNKADLDSLISNLKTQTLDQLKDSTPVSENISENEDSNLIAPIVNIKEELVEVIPTNEPDQHLIHANLKDEKPSELSTGCNKEVLNKLESFKLCIGKKEVPLEIEMSVETKSKAFNPQQQSFHSSHRFIRHDDSIVDSEVREVINNILNEISLEATSSPKQSFETEMIDINDLCNQLLDQVCANILHQPIVPLNLDKDSPRHKASHSSQKISTEPSHSQITDMCETSLELSETPQKRKEDKNESEEEETQSSFTDLNKRRGKRSRRGSRRKAPQNQSDRNLEEKSEPDCQTTPTSTPTADSRGKIETKSRGRRGAARGRGRRVSIPELQIIESAERSPSPQPVKRQSRRIQALQEKKNAELAEKVKREQQQLEEMAKKMQANKLKSQENSCDSFKSKESRKSSYKTETSSDESDPVCEKIKSKKRKKKKRGKGCPWDSASSSSESSEEEEEEEVEEEDFEVLQFDDNEDEFACEEPDPDAEPIILKRARTAKKVKEKPTDQESNSEAEEVNDDTPCQRCGKYDHPEWILLCDKCDVGFHTACLRPPLMLIPDGDWYCPPCENQFLLGKLQERFESLSKALEKKELEEMRKQRLKQVAVSLDALSKAKPKVENRRKSNEERERVAKPSRRISDEEEFDDDSDEDSDESDYLMLRSARSRKRISYQFTEYDAMINSAIQDEGYEEVPQDVPFGQSRGKDMATIEHALKQQEAEEREEQLKLKTEGEVEVEVEKENADLPEQPKVDTGDAIEPKEEDDDSDFEPQKTRKVARQARKRRLNDLEPPSEDDDSDESFKGGSDTEIEDASEESLEESLDEEEESNDSWRDLKRSKKSRGRRVIRGKSGKKKGGYRRDDFVVDSDDSDYGAGKRSRTRAAAKKRVSYKEFTSDEEEEEEEFEWKTSKNKKRRLSGSDTSDEEWTDEDDDDIRGKKKKKSKAVSEEEDEEEEEEEEDEEEEDAEEEEEEEMDLDSEEESRKRSKKDVDRKHKKQSRAVKTNEEFDEEEDVEEEDEQEDDEQEEKDFKEKKSKKHSGEETSKKEKSPKIKITKKFEMRGKPRLSKARMMSLAENSDDSQETKTTPDDEPEQAPVDSCENVHVPSGPVQAHSREAIQVAIVEPKTSLPIHMMAPAQPEINEPQRSVHGEGPVHPMAPPMHIEHQPVPPPMNVPPVMPPNMMLPTSRPSALSQLTAFASKGPGQAGPAPMNRPVNPNYGGHHPSQPLHPHGSDKEESDYSIMSLDAFGNSQRPMKPSMTSENYLPPTSSPSQLLNLESTQYNPQGPPPHMTNMERFPGMPPNNFPPNAKAPDPRTSGPFPESIPPPRNYHPRQPYPPQPGNFPPDVRGFYDPRMMTPNHGPNTGPYPHPSIHQSNSPYRQRSGPMPHYGPNPGSRPGPGSGPYFPQPGPGFYPGPPPPQSSRSGAPNRPPPHMPQGLVPPGRPTGPHTRERPPPYPGPPHLYPSGHPASMSGHFPPNAFYPHPGEFLPNGGFMIQNLLHAPLPNQPNPSLNRTNGLEGPAPTGSPTILSNPPHTSSSSGPPPPVTSGTVQSPPPTQPPVSQQAQSVPISSPSD